MQETGTSFNAITGLPNMKWRSLEAPDYAMASVSGGHSLARRPYPYQKGVSHQHTGTNSFLMPFSLFFNNSLKRLNFPQLFEEWVNAVVHDPTAGELRHPLMGKVDARVDTWAVDLDANRIDGVIMQINFEQTVLDPEEQVTTSGVTINLHDAATQADEAMHKLGIEYPTGERTTSLTDMVNQIDSLVFSSRLTLEGMINQALGTIANIIETVENVQEHVTWALEDMLKQLYDGLAKLGTPAVKGTNRLVLTRTLDHDDTLDGVARDTRNSVGEIITLNPKLLSSPQIKSGMAVSFFGDGAYK